MIFDTRKDLFVPGVQRNRNCKGFNNEKRGNVTLEKEYTYSHGKEGLKGKLSSSSIHKIQCLRVGTLTMYPKTKVVIVSEVTHGSPLSELGRHSVDEVDV